jgi:hypothetical protein
MKYTSSRVNSDITTVDDNQRGIRTGFTPSRRLIGLNLQDFRVKEGLRLTLELIGRMNDICSEKRVQLLVVLIPTKESVYAEYIAGKRNLRNSAVIDELIANEREINQRMRKYFAKHDISYVDVLPDLRRAVPTRPYFANTDGHPNADGYVVIAKAVNRFLSGFNPRGVHAVAY